MITRVVVFYFLNLFLSPGVSPTQVMAARKSAMLSVDDPEVRLKVEALLKRTNECIFWMLMKTSPLLWIGLCMVIFCTVVSVVFKHCFRQSLALIFKTEMWRKFKAIIAAIWVESEEELLWGRLGIVAIDKSFAS